MTEDRTKFIEAEVAKRKHGKFKGVLVDPFPDDLEKPEDAQPLDSILSSRLKKGLILRPLDQPPLKSQPEAAEPGRQVKAIVKRISSDVIKWEYSGPRKLRYALEHMAVPFEFQMQGLTRAGSKCLAVRSGKITRQFWQALLVCGWKIIETGEKPEFGTAEELQEYWQRVWKLKLDKDFLKTPHTVVTQTDIQKVLRDPDLSSKDCDDIMFSIPAVVFQFEEFKGFCEKEDRKGRLQKYSVKSGEVGPFGVIRYDKVEPVQFLKELGFGPEAVHRKRGLGRGEPESVYAVYWISKPGLAFIHNLMVGAYNLLKNKGPVTVEKFFSLPPAKQMIICAYWSWNKWRREVPAPEELLAVTGRKPYKDKKNRVKQLQMAATEFQDLVDEGWFPGVKRVQALKAA